MENTQREARDEKIVKAAVNIMEAFIPGFKKDNLLEDLRNRDFTTKKKRSIAMEVSRVARGLIPGCGMKTLELLSETELTPRQVKEIAEVSSSYGITPYKVAKILAEEGIDFNQMLEIVEMAKTYGHLASYNQMIKAFKMCGDIDVLGYFLDSAEEYLSYESGCSGIVIPQKRLAFLFHICEESYMGDLAQLACVFTENALNEVLKIFNLGDFRGGEDE